MFFTNVNDVAGDTDTAALKNTVASSGSTKQPMAYVLVQGGGRQALHVRVAGGFHNRGTEHCPGGQVLCHRGGANWAPRPRPRGGDSQLRVQQGQHPGRHP